MVPCRLPCTLGCRPDGRHTYRPRYRRVEHLLQYLIIIAHARAYTRHALLAPHLCHLAGSLLTEALVHKGELRIEDGIHRPDGTVVLHRHIGHREHAAGEVLGRGDGALHRVGIETQVATSLFVLGNEPLAHEPLAEVLPHHRLQHATAQGQLAGR